MHIKNIHSMIEKLSECAKVELDKGVENIDTKEMGEVAEIIKELSEAEYYAKISKAMDEAEYGEDYDYMGAYDERKGYRDQPRDSRGRYMRRRGRMGYIEPMMYDERREADYMDGKMYYDGSASTDGGQMASRMQRDGESESRYDRARRGYEEAKNMNDNSADGKRKSMENLESYMKELSEDMTQFVGKMDANEKAMVKSKLQNLITKF